MIANIIFTILKKRWKFYVIGYLVFYAYLLILDETIDMYHLMPIKLFPITFGLITGTAFYYGSIKLSRMESAIRLVKYILPGMTVFVIGALLQDYLKKKGIDISIFVGLPK